MKIELEPARYGRTGHGIGLHTMRPGFQLDAVSYAIDAPAFIPRGSVAATAYPAPKNSIVEPYVYLHCTKDRP